MGINMFFLVNYLFKYGWIFWCEGDILSLVGFMGEWKVFFGKMGNIGWFCWGL